jgi:hypothetical protein
MKRYKVTTEVSLIVYAEVEDDAASVAGMELLEKDFDDISQYYEVEEVLD